jgi:CDP-glucose 4,6-dehydratase
LSYAHTYGLPVAITRCGNFYGGGDLNWNRIVPGTIRSVLDGNSPVVRSDGNFVRDYLYVEDGASAYMQLVEKMSENRDLIGEAFNFSNESQVSVLQIVKTILRLMNSSLTPTVMNQASNEIRNQYLDASKAKNILNWCPEHSLESGLIKTIDWYSQNFSQK